MKSYYCKICSSRGKRFLGTRKDVREHIRVYHRIKKSKEYKQMEKIETKKKKSLITKRVGKVRIMCVVGNI